MGNVGKSTGLVISFAALVAASPALAKSFESNDVSVVAKGQSGAGQTAGSDIGASGHNPAVVGTVETGEVAIGGYYRFSDRSGTSSVNGASADVDGDIFSGSGAAAIRASDNIALGIAVYQPRRLKTDYPANFPSAGDIISDHLRSVTIQPNVAVTLGDNFHLGAGVGFTRLNAALSQATLTGPGMISGKDWAFNFSVGAVYEFDGGGSVGISYRSRTDFDFDSTISPGFTVPTPGGPVNIGGAARVSGDFPASFSAGLIVPASPNLRLSGEVQWTNWSEFNIVTINTAAGPVLPLINNSRDSWLVAAGAEYGLSGGAAIRAGIAYDSSSVRTPPGNVRFPFDDSVTLAIGGSVPLGDTIMFDAAFTHEFMGKSTAQVVNGAPGSTVAFTGDRNSVALGFRFGF